MERYNLVPQGISAEMIADKWEIPRSELDELARALAPARAARRPRRAASSARSIPFQVNGDTYVADQGIRPDTSLEALAGLKPAFKPDGKITAGNSSQISDGAAAVLLMSRRQGRASSALTPRARIVDQTTVGVDPVMMLTGPIPATRKLLERNGMTIDDIDLFEVNEAFAPVVARLAARARARHGPRQRQRRRDGARPPARLDRRAAADHAAARARALRQGDRARDDVLRRRPRHRHAHPARLARLNRVQPAGVERACARHRARCSLGATG